jgi:Tfp pilus assembly protein PilO
MKNAGLFDRLALDKKKYLLIIIVWIIIIYIDFNYLFRLQFASLKTSSRRISQLQNEILSLDKELDKLKTSQDGTKGGQRSTKFRRLITLDQIPDLLKKISDAANSNKVVIMQIKPAAEQTNKEIKPVTPVNLTPIFINLDLIADYHSLGSFISALENLEEFVSVENLSISRQEKDYFREKISLVLRTYAEK